MNAKQIEWLAANGINTGKLQDYMTGELADRDDLTFYSRGVHTVVVNTINKPTIITMQSQRGPTTWTTTRTDSLKSALGWLTRTDATDKIGHDSF